MANNVIDSTVKLVNNNVVTGTNKALSTEWSTTLSYVSYGTGTTDLWGNTLTPTLVNRSDFGVVLSAVNTTGFSPYNPYVDHIRITVYYTPTGKGFFTLLYRIRMLFPKVKWPDKFFVRKQERLVYLSRRMCPIKPLNI